MGNLIGSNWGRRKAKWQPSIFGLKSDIKTLNLGLSEVHDHLQGVQMKDLGLLY